MNVFINVLLTFSIVYGIYIIFCAILSALADKELKERGIYPDENGDYIIFCGAESLEFLIRCALWATTFERGKIIVLINGDDETSTQIAQMMMKKHKSVIMRRN